MRMLLNLVIASALIATLGCGGGVTKKKLTFTDVGNGLGKTAGAGDAKKSDGEGVAKSKGPWRAPASRRPAEPAAMVGDAGKIKPPEEREPQSGILTAGSYDDNRHPTGFLSFVNKISSGQNSTIANKLGGNKLILTVKGSDGKPVGNARVHIRGERGGAGVRLITRTDGRVIFISSIDGVAPDEDLRVTVTPPGNSTPVTQTVQRDKTSHEIVLAKTPAPLPRKLDLAIVLDTTGSMGDEMNYLKSEMRAIASEIKRRFPQVEQRYGLIVYRDDGDAYVSRMFPFTTSLDEFRTTLHKQNAAGGGDTPEAMHRGLENAAQLAWSEDNAARVLFLVADAPPHQRHAERTLKAVQTLRQMGVAIYPVAGSGTEKTCEFFMRAGAMLTGGQYLFLTDDSGVGNAHAEPNVQGYYVQRLDHLMIRMIAGELAGRRIGPRADRILRTVGQPLEKIEQGGN